jgi:hypothetical protein
VSRQDTPGPKPQPRTKPNKRAAVLRTLLVYAVLASVLAVIVGHFSIPRYWRMLHDGQAASAVVVRTECDNHGSVYYRLEVSGREYVGVGNAGFGTPECDHLKAGDRIAVYYLLSDPNVSLPGRIRDRWDNELIFVLLASTIFPALIISVVRRNLRRRAHAAG